jgi:large subunit ribosomal protein L3
MTRKLMGRKRGMTRLFDEKGNAVVATVIEIEPNVVTQIKTTDVDGYEAVQLGFEKVTTNDPRTIERRVKKPLRGHFAKANVEPRRFLQEFKTEKLDNFTVGQEINVDLFKVGEYLDVTATSKGKGFQGAMKLHNFAGGRATHGNSLSHRALGSTGMRSSPGRCFKGGPRASHMGDDTVTVQNLEVVMVSLEDNVILVKGAVPGARDALVTIEEAVKKYQKKS